MEESDLGAMKDLQDQETLSVVDAYERAIMQLRKWRDKIEASLGYANNSHTFDDVCKLVLSGQMQLFAFDDAFAIMEYKQYPEYAVYHCFLAGGSIPGLMACQEQIIDVAKSAGCKYVTLSGRKGWERAFAPMGWKPYCTALCLEIS